MLRIRLRRVGKKGKPSYRIVVAESAAPRDGAYLEWIGNYDPMADPPAITLKEDRAAQWLSKGAQPTDAVARILDKNGLLQRTEEFRTATRKSGAEAPAPVAAAATPTATTTPTAVAEEDTAVEETAPAEANVDDAPTDEAETPVDEAPAEGEEPEAPVEEAPAEEEEPETPVEEAPAEEAPAEEASEDEAEE